MTAAIDIGTRRELFVDRYLVERLSRAELRLHHPQRAGAVLVHDRPWEGILTLHVTVLEEGDTYRMYYRGWPQKPGLRANDPGQHPPVTCYAESRDGVHWQRPSLGLHQVFGTRQNNVVLAGPRPVTQRFSPMLDTRPGVPASERLKALGGNKDTGLVLYSSGDGIHWEPMDLGPVVEGYAFDSQNTIFWSQHEQCYVCVFRHMQEVEGQRVRWLARTTSPDLAQWTRPEIYDFGEAPAEHLYTNQMAPYFRAPHLYVGTAARFLPGRWALSPAQEEAMDLHGEANYSGLPGALSDGVLLTSRGGNHIDRTFLESFVRAGEDPRDWVARSNYPALGVVATGEREMSLYVSRHYGQPSAYLERLTLRTDGFASLHAGYGGGEMVTRPLVFSGRELEINFATSAAGGLRMELQVEGGAAIEGYALADCEEQIGDEVERVVRWKGGSDLSALARRPVRVRVVLKDGDLYSVRFGGGD